MNIYDIDWIQRSKERSCWEWLGLSYIKNMFIRLSQISVKILSVTWPCGMSSGRKKIKLGIFLPFEEWVGCREEHRQRLMRAEIKPLRNWNFWWKCLFRRIQEFLVWLSSNKPDWYPWGRGFDPWPRSVGLGSGGVMSCGTSCRHGSDLVLLWLWHRPMATALIWHLAWELLYISATAKIKK